EAVTWSFMDKAASELFGGGPALDLINPISTELATMRPSILPNLIQAAARNAARGYADVALFEVGPVFHERHNLAQTTVAAGIRAGAKSARSWSGKSTSVDAF